MHPLVGMSIMLALLLAVTTPSKGKKDDKDRPPGGKGGPGVSINIYQGVTPPRGGREEVVVKKDGEEVKV